MLVKSSNSEHWFLYNKYYQRLVKARTEHKCFLCETSIRKSTYYIYSSMGPWDGINNYCWTYRAHLICNTFSSKIVDDYDNLYDEEMLGSKFRQLISLGRCFEV